MKLKKGYRVLGLICSNPELTQAGEWLLCYLEQGEIPKRNKTPFPETGKGGFQ
jgi:hypothetical protein